MTETMRSNDVIAREVLRQGADEWLDEQYINYALYVIRSRALVSRDGIKPVNRRLIWNMFNSGILPTSQYVKAAQISGNTTGIYHPHAGTAASEALARMAQKFSMRVPLIDYSGTVGFVTGDSPAADRYWEARLTQAAVELVKESKNKGAALTKNFDGTHDEPFELPVRWPVDIINGSEGIAVGFASNMPSHNPTEVMDALKAYLKNPDLTTKQLMRYMKGPDFPTGGELVGVDGIKDYYETGKGTFRVRGRYHIEDMSRGRKRIIFYELPYGVSVEKIRVKISAVQNAGGLKGIAAHRDSTDRKNGLRFVIETKAGSNHLAVINEIFKKTDAESSFSVNSTVIRDNAPTVVAMKDMLGDFIEFRREIIERMSTNRLEDCKHRKHQLDAILAALVDIDKAISIIRNADTAAVAKKELRKEFHLDDVQADYILSMQLRRLTKADSIETQNEKDALDEEIHAIHELMSDPERMNQRILNDLEATKKIIGDKRRTVISGLTAEDAKEAEKAAAKAASAIEKNAPCYITRFSTGRLLMTMDPFQYPDDASSLEHGLISEQIKINTKDSLVVVLSDGTGHRVPASYVSTSTPSALDDLGISTGDAELVGIAKASLGKNDVGLAMMSRNGTVKISKADWPSRAEFPVFTLDDDDSIVGSRWLGRSIKATFFVAASSDGNALVFPADSVRVAGSKSGGVKGMKLKDGARVVGFDWIRSATASDTTTLSFTGKTVKLTPIAEIPTKNKGGMGVNVHSFKKGERELVGFYAGTHPAITVTTGDLEEAISLPALSTKRGGPSTAMALPARVGGREVEVL